MGEAIRSNKRFLQVCLALLVLIALVYPLAKMYDDKVDRRRAVYEAREEVAVLLHDAAAAELPLPSTTSPSTSLSVGDERYTAPDGVTVLVKVRGGDFCVRSANTDGDEAPWRCWDLDEDPEQEPGSEDS